MGKHNVLWKLLVSLVVIVATAVLLAGFVNGELSYRAPAYMNSATAEGSN